MPNYGGLGLVSGITEGLDNLRAKLLQDKTEADKEKQQAFEDKLQENADTREQELQPGRVSQQQANLGLTNEQLRGEKQTNDFSSKVTPLKLQQAGDDAKIAHNNAIQSKLNLDNESWNNLHTSIYASARVMNDQVENAIKGTGQGVNTGAIEQVYNEKAPAGQRIKPGTLQISVDNTHPGESQIQYVGDDGKPRKTTLAAWNQVAAAYVPPSKPIALGKDSRLVEPNTGKVLTDTAPGAGVSDVSPNSWSNSAAAQLAKNYGGMIDAQGNLTGLTNEKSRLVGDLAGVASAYGKAHGYSIPPQTVAAAAKAVYDQQGISPTDSKFMGALDAEIKKYQGTNLGVQVAPDAPASVGGLPNPLKQTAAALPTDQLLTQAKQAIQNGKDPTAVRQRLKELGVSDNDIQNAGL